MTDHERLLQLKEEISSSMAQYKAFRGEINRRAENGEKMDDIIAERESVFKLCNALLDEYHTLISSIRANQPRHRQDRSSGRKSES